MRTVSLLLPLVMLQCGCASLHVMSHVPLSTMSRLSAMKLAEIQPDQLRVAARMPEHLEPRRDGVKVTITVGSSKMEMTLEPASEARELTPLSRFEQRGMRIWSYRLSAADSARVQGMIAKAGGNRIQVSIAAGVEACRRRWLGAGPLPTTTFLRTDDTGFMILAEDLDLRSVVPEAELAAKVPPCA